MPPAAPLRRPPTPAEAYAERKARRLARELRDATRAVLSTPAGRQVLAAIVEQAGVHHSIWTASAEIHYRAGRQDFGHELMAQLLEADEDLYETMEREKRDRVRRDRAEDAAFEAEEKQTL